jgi:hypothetical protein
MLVWFRTFCSSTFCALIHTHKNTYMHTYIRTHMHTCATNLTTSCPQAYPEYIIYYNDKAKAKAPEECVLQ